MTRNSLRRTGLVLLSLLLPLSAQDEKELRELLREALYTEEVTRDSESAAKQYEKLLSQHDTQRAFAASALFRLAEVRRKQDRKDEAIALYQKLLARFPEAGAEAKLARENLAALGGKPAEADQPREMSPAEKSLRNQQDVIAHLKPLADDSPDMLKEQLNPAISSDWPLVVEYLLSKGVDPGTPGALGTAANLGKLSICKLLLQKGKPSPEEAGKAMAEAVRAGRMAILSYLLDQGLDPESPIPWSSGVSITPLWVAVEAGSLEAAKVLLDRGADIDFMVHPSGDPRRNELIGTALHYAVQRENGVPMVRLLLERGAKPDLPTPVGGLTPLHFAALQFPPDSSTMVSELLAKGADPNRRSTLRLEGDGQSVFDPLERATPFEVALEKNATEKIRMMLKKGADLKALDRHGWPPLGHAIVASSPELARELIAAGADPNGRNASGMPTLLSAVIAAVNSEAIGRSPEDHVEARARHREMVQVLLDAGADPSAGHEGKTPLSETVERKNLEPICELLLAKGANLNFHDRYGHTLLTEALREKDSKRLDWLLSAKADLDFADQDGCTPLLLALQLGDSESARRLIEAGADPNKPHGQLSPLTAAGQMDSDQRWPIVELLLAKGAKPEAGNFRVALNAERWDLALRMLDGGAPLPDFSGSFPGQTSFIRALRVEKALPVIRRMVEMGAKPDDGWIESGFKDGYYTTASTPIASPVRSYLFRTFMLPRLEAAGGIRSVQPEENQTTVSVLAEKSPAGRPVPLARLLLDPKQELRWSKRVVPTDRLTVWRKSGEQWVAAHEFALNREAEFPALEWGDVIELSDGPEPAAARGTNDLPITPELEWSLRQRVSFPVKVVIDGKKRDITLRGDRLVFDPAAPDQMPFAGARRVAELLWTPEFNPWNSSLPRASQKVEVVIRRDGWPEARVPFFSSGEDFPLQAGDEVSLESAEIAADERLRLRKASVVVKGLDAPYALYFGQWNDSANMLDPRSVPSLIQALAQTIRGPLLPAAPADAAAWPAWFLAQPVDSVAYLQRPDLSRLRIRRLQADGSETVLHVDLAKAIDQNPADATPDQVRRHDVILQAGDIVEVPVAPSDEAKPWAGLSAKEEAFFSKALSCRIQLTGGDGEVGLKEVVYHSPRFVPTAAGLVPVPTAEGVPSLGALEALKPRNHAGIVVNRDGLAESSFSPHDLFLRDGDRVVLPPISAPVPGTQRPPRPRGSR